MICDKALTLMRKILIIPDGLLKKEIRFYPLIRIKINVFFSISITITKLNLLYSIIRIQENIPNFVFKLPIVAKF